MKVLYVNDKRDAFVTQGFDHGVKAGIRNGKLNPAAKRALERFILKKVYANKKPGLIGLKITPQYFHIYFKSSDRLFATNLAKEVLANLRNIM